MVAMVVVALIVGGGAMLFVSGDSPDSTSDQSATDGSSPTSEAQLKVRPRGVINNGNSMTMRIWVDVKMYGYDNLTYHDVQVCMFDASGTVLASRTIDNVSSPQRKIYEYNITVSERPTYYLIHHPDLKSDPKVITQEYKWNSGSETYTIIEPDDIGFEFPRTNETGTCA